jgi:hypothetical protein
LTAFFVEKAIKTTIIGLLRTFGPMDFAKLQMSLPGAERRGIKPDFRIKMGQQEPNWQIDMVVIK